ncbi:MAG: hypothetical protein Q9188_006185 [Gyalolechia gomerana]
MALEALGIAANVAGLVELGLSVCHGLWEYYGSWKDAESDVKKMYAAIESLTKTFAILRDTLGRPCLDGRIVRRIEEIVGLCEDGIICLHRKLQKIRDTSPTGSRSGTKFKAHLQRALYPFRESTLVKLKEISIELQDHLLLALNILQVDSLSMSLQAMEILSSDVGKVSLGIKKLDDDLSQASNSISKLTASQQDQHLSTVHDWLSPLFRDFVSKHHETLMTTARQDGLGHWLLDSPKYKQWLSDEGKILLCLGSRGIGKTVLALRSFLIEHLQKTKATFTGIAFLYCNYKDPQKQTALNILGCLLQQLMLQSAYIADEVAECFERHRTAKTLPSISEYSSLLQSAVGYFTQTIFVVDALDECLDETRDIIFEEISKIPRGLSILVTSRHALNILHGSQTTITVKLKANDMDITRYLEARVNKSKLLRAQISKDKSLHDYLVSSIVGKAKGMFLLARLQFDSLMAKPTLRKVKSALNSLPEELDSMYDQAFERIQNQDPEFAALALKLIYWIHYAIRPLKVEELRHAVAVEFEDESFDEEGLPDEDLLESICAGMVTRQENDTVSLVHYTAQEYLERHSSSLFPAAQATIVQTCLTYLSFDDFRQGPCPDDESFTARCARYPLILYASQHWAEHLHIVGEMELEQAILDFLSQKDQLKASVQAAQVIRSPYPYWSQEFAKDVNGLWLASSCGLLQTCATLLQRGADVNACDSHGQTPLHRATIRGYADIVQLLYDHNVHIEARSHDFGRTPLHWAALHGHQDIVRLMLAIGAFVEAQDRRKWTALHLAASKGHEEVLRLLLDKSLDINAKDGYGATALYHAAEGGHEGAARVLLEKGAHTDIGNHYDQTALHRAADLGYLATTRLLLEHGAAYDLKDYYGWTPLYRALDHGHSEVATLLADFAETAREASRQEQVKPRSGPRHSGSKEHPICMA